MPPVYMTIVSCASSVQSNSLSGQIAFPDESPKQQPFHVLASVKETICFLQARLRDQLTPTTLDTLLLAVSEEELDLDAMLVDIDIVVKHLRRRGVPIGAVLKLSCNCQTWRKARS